VVDYSKLKRPINPMPDDVEKKLIKENLMESYRKDLYISKTIIWVGY